MYNSFGQASKMFLILAIVIFVAIIIVFVVMKAVQKPLPPVTPSITPVPTPVYDATMNDIKFIFLEAKDMGSILKRDQVIGNYKPDKNLTTTEKFIKITVAAQNKGKMNTKYNEWDIGNIVDSQGRNFIPADFSASPWLPQQNQCGAVLEPEFQPIPCVKMYKVSRESKDLKIQVLTTKEGQSGKDVAYLDLIVTK